jgi:hypothetical protein
MCGSPFLVHPVKPDDDLEKLSDGDTLKKESRLLK